MTQLYAWALCKDGNVVEIYRTELGAKRGHTRFTADLGKPELKRWRVLRLRCLFDELEGADAKR